MSTEPEEKCGAPGPLETTCELPRGHVGMHRSVHLVVTSESLEGVPAEDEYYEPGPFVCPGCYAVGDEPCAHYCPDAAIERQRIYDRDCRDEGDEPEDGDGP